MSESAYFAHARKELAPKMANSAFVISVNTEEIDPKIAMETGYAILLGKPILLVAFPGQTLHPGLQRVADKVVTLEHPLDSDAGQIQLQAAMAEFTNERDVGFKFPAPEGGS